MKNLFFLLSLAFLLFFSNAKAAPGYWEWVRQSGSYEDVSGQCMGIDQSGNIILLGHFSSPSMSLSGVVINNSGGNSRSFIAKYAPDGTLIWLRPLTSDPLSIELANVLTCDHEGNFIVGGWFNNTLTIDSIVLTDPPALGNNLFLAKFDGNGQVIWAKSFSNGFSIFWDMTADANGNILATGGFQSSSAQFDSFTLQNHVSTGSRDVFTLKCNGSGDVLWVSQAGGMYDDCPNNITVDVNGNAIVSGLFRSSTMECGSINLQNSSIDSTDEIFIYKLDMGGNVLWAKSAGSTDHDNSVEATTDLSGNIYLTGNFEGDTTYFDTIKVFGNGSCSNTYLVCLSSTGIYTWAMSYGRMNNNNIAKGVSFDANNDFYLGGNFAQTLHINGQILISRGGIDIYIAKFDAGRNLIWQCTAGGNGLDLFSNMIKDDLGNIYVTGYSTSQNTYFDSQSTNYPPGSSSNVYNFYVAKLSQIPSTGIKIPFVSDNSMVFPNPSSDKFYIQSDIAGSLSVEVFNQAGEKIISEKFENFSGLYFPLDLTNFKRGIYLIKVSGEGVSKTKKVLLE